MSHREGWHHGTMTTKPGDETRQALIAAAERLMAEHGIDGVDLKDIQAAAGQRNRSAIAYHFGDRAGLVRAIGITHRKAINRERNHQLDLLEQAGEDSLRSFTGALVRPLAESLRDASGRSYIIILAEGATRLGTSGLYQAKGEHTDSVIRWIRHVEPHLTGSRAHRRLLIGQAILVVPVLMADIARGIDRDDLTVRQGLRRVSSVIDFVVHALSRNAT